MSETLATLSHEDVFKLTYPDFVALLGQVNTPPGDVRTIGEWIAHAEIGWKSRLLDLACSTGFSSRTISARTGADCTGVDLSSAAIEWARVEAERVGLRQLRYIVGNAAALPVEDRYFSHVVAGSCFGFIHERERALAETARVLRQGGYLCIATYHYSRQPPDALLQEFEKLVGFRPRGDQDLKYWFDFFGRYFKSIWLQEHPIEVHDLNLLAEAVRQQIERPNTPIASAPDRVKQACFERLLTTRQCIRRHQQYQKLAVIFFQKAS